MKLSKAFSRAIGKRYLWVPLILTLIITMTPAIVPVHAGHTNEYFWAVPAVKSGEAVDTLFNVSVGIENAWDMVGWALSVHVDPDVLEVLNVTEGPFLFDWLNATYPTEVEWGLMYTDFMLGSVNKTTGYINDTSCQIVPYNDIPDGEAANGTGILCECWFKSKSLTAYSLIDLFDVRVYDHHNKTYMENVTDGHYNEPPVGVCGVNITDVVFSKGGIPVTDGYPSWTINVTVTVHNNGSVPINCTVNAYYQNGTTWILIGTQPITDLPPCNTTTLTFNWNLAGLTPCTNYNVKANATCTCDASDEFTTTIYIRLTCDTNNNNFVGSDDIIVVQKTENYAQTPPANPYADVNGNGFVGSDDIIVIQKTENYAQSCP